MFSEDIERDQGIKWLVEELNSSKILARRVLRNVSIKSPICEIGISIVSKIVFIHVFTLLTDGPHIIIICK